MSFNRDMAKDRDNTGDILDKIHDPEKAKNWLGHGGMGGQIDAMLLEGATVEMMMSTGRLRGSVQNHIYHLRDDHGLTVEELNGVFSLYVGPS